MPPNAIRHRLSRPRTAGLWALIAALVVLAPTLVSHGGAVAANKAARPQHPADASVFTGRGPLRGAVRVSDGRLVDERGPFWALGASYMAAAWFQKHGRAALARNLETLSAAGVDYVRVLGAVGGEWWTGRETDPRWSDYEAIIAGLTDLAHDRFGLRVAWTLFGDTTQVPTPEARRALVARFVELAAARPQKLMHFEVANEAYQNGFEGADGLRELRALTDELVRGLRSRGVTLPVASSSPPSASCDDLRMAASNTAADLASVHFPRALDGRHGVWGPVLAPLSYRECRGTLPVATNGEPVGPGSSVEREEDPRRLVSAAAVTFVAGLPLYVFHSSAGVRGDVAFADLPNAVSIFAGLRALREVLPRHLPTGETITASDDRHPFEGPAPPNGGSGPLLGAPASLIDAGAVVVIAGERGELTLTARRAMRVRALDAVRGTWSAPRDLAARDVLRLAPSEAVIRVVWR